MDKINTGNRIKWLDCAKTIAILAVLTDHSNGILYNNNRVSMLSYFSVTLFILLAGMTSYISNSHHRQDSCFCFFFRSSKKILGAYIFATIMYTIRFAKFLEFFTVIKSLIFFNSTGPFYYVILYIQLMLVSKLLYSLMEYSKIKHVIAWETLLGMIIIGLSCFTTNCSNILDIYGGGGKLLGGSYLIVFYVGMLIEKYRIFESNSLKKSIFFAVVSFILWLLWGHFECIDRFGIDSKIPFGYGLNPPSITSITMAIIMMCLSYGFFTLMQRIRVLSWITELFALLGKHTLYIFLYHRLFLDGFLQIYVKIDNMILKRVVYFGVMILGSIFIELIARRALNWIKSVIKDVQTSTDTESLV